MSIQLWKAITNTEAATVENVHIDEFSSDENIVQSPERSKKKLKGSFAKRTDSDSEPP